MTYTTTIQEFLAGISPFDQLSPTTLSRLSSHCQLLRYRMGQAIFVREKMPSQIAILFQGQARLLGYHPRRQAPVTLKLLQPGEIFGWVSLLRGIPCETAIASSEAVCLTFNATEFLTLIEAEPNFASAFRNRCTLIEIFDLLALELERRADGERDLKELTLQAWSSAIIYNLVRGRKIHDQLDPSRLWFVSGGASATSPVGTCLDSEAVANLEVQGPGVTRLVGIPASIFSP
ncbi:MAG TPA: cyclic nucleotide-binding domain-containing protein, partial [Cyanophyceae cyanobacterium]